MTQTNRLAASGRDDETRKRFSSSLSKLFLGCSDGVEPATDLVKAPASKDLLLGLSITLKVDPPDVGDSSKALPEDFRL